MAPTVAPFPGDTYVDVTGTIGRAVEAVRAHVSQDETRQFEHPIRARAMYHGHRIGVQYAEVFKSLWRMMDVRP
jgi:LmbE family N-acetylglucosaminyl deacetylase